MGKPLKIEDHIDWAARVASKFRKERNIPIEHKEAVSLGMVGLMEAARYYKNDKGKEFRSIAWLRIRGAIRDNIRMEMAQKRCAEIVSLENIPVWHLPSVNGTEKRVVNKDFVKHVLGSLSFDQSYAVERYYLHDINLSQIGSEMGVTDSRISQLLTKGRNNAREIWAGQI